MPAKNDDLLQLGGDFILDNYNRLVYSHPSKEPTDRPTVEELLNALRAIAPVSV